MQTNKHFQKSKYKIVRNFFWFCSGVRREILEECTTDHNKYAAIGATVFFTAFFASLSGGYAMYFVFKEAAHATAIASAFGVIWGLTIFNLDRFLVLSIKKRDNPWREFLIASPRLLLAIMVGIVIARPIELKIFDKEIKEGIRRYYQQKMEHDNYETSNIFDEKHANEHRQLAEKKALRDSAKKALEIALEYRDAECLGKLIDGRTTGKVGVGPNCMLRRAEVENKTALLENYDREITDLENTLTDLRTASGINKSVEIDSYLDSLTEHAGFFMRNKMLGKISGWALLAENKREENPSDVKENHNDTNKSAQMVAKKPIELDSVRQLKTKDSRRSAENTAKFIELDGQNDPTAFFISLLFIVVECMPVVVKLMSGRGMYDMRLEEEDKRLSFKLSQETNRERHLIHKITLSDREIINRAVEQRHNKEINRDDLDEKFFKG